MEAIFINRLAQTKENLLEMNMSYDKVKRITVQVIIAVIFVALGVLYFLIDLVLPGILMLALAVVFPFLLTLKLRLHCKNSVKQQMILYNKVVEGETSFYDEELKSVSEAGKTEITLEYSKIKKVKQSKNLYLLVLDKRLVVMVDKNRFEKGTAADFEEFIKQKAVNAKIKL